MLPIPFGRWPTVYGRLQEFARRILFRAIHDLTLMVDRKRAGRAASPSTTATTSKS
jgi:hypothetical protein